MASYEHTTKGPRELKDLDCAPECFIFEPWARSQRSSRSCVENSLIVALQSGWES